MMIKTAGRAPRVNLMFTVAILTMAVLFPATFPAPSWGGCHCFKERSFDPLQPASADPYVLATARNSLVAAAAGISKGKVVKMRMTGAGETDVWLESYLLTEAGKADAATSTYRAAEKAGNRDAMAAALADRVLARTYRADDKTISELRAAGADTAAAALSLFVSSRTKPSPLDIFSRVNSGKATWGKTVSALGIALDTTGDRIMEDVRKAALRPGNP